MAYDNKRRGREQNGETPVRFQDGQPVFREGRSYGTSRGGAYEKRATAINLTKKAMRETGLMAASAGRMATRIPAGSAMKAMKSHTTKSATAARKAMRRAPAASSLTAKKPR